MRWRWTSHQGRTWRRKRALSAGVSSDQSVCTCGRAASITARQPTPAHAARRTSRRTAANRASSERRSSAVSRSPSQAAAGPWPWGRRPRREIGVDRAGESRRRAWRARCRPWSGRCRAGRPARPGAGRRGRPRPRGSARSPGTDRRRAAGCPAPAPRRRPRWLRPLAGHELEPAAGAAHGGRVVGDEEQIVAAVLAGDRLAQQLLDVAAVDRAADERAGDRALAGLLARLGSRRPSQRRKWSGSSSNALMFSARTLTRWRGWLLP